MIACDVYMKQGIISCLLIYKNLRNKSERNKKTSSCAIKKVFFIFSSRHKRNFEKQSRFYVWESSFFTLSLPSLLRLSPREQDYHCTKEEVKETHCYSWETCKSFIFRKCLFKAKIGRIFSFKFRKQLSVLL